MSEKINNSTKKTVSNKTKSVKSKLGDGMQSVTSEVVLKPLEQVIHESMMPYSEFVIMDRALPRVEDGLKPVQRRVLYSMLEVGVTPDKPYRKSARIVGDCMGKYHPHGDKSIYDTMVRMAQSFNMGEPLVDGHGNYGSVDGDSAAAMRYTEARLTPISLELLKDIEKETVTWSFNFDDSTKEPDMLPGRFPNLLVNGSSGIAVGLATNIPTHNLGEVIDVVVGYIENNNITLDEMIKLMPAPDFSTGATILRNSSEIEKIYSTGKGKLVIRSKTHIENDDNGKKNIVITEIPYQVNKANMLQKIIKLRESNPNTIYSNIYDIVDESDRTGTRAVIKLKKDTNVERLMELLYKSSDLQVNFNANMVAIAGGKPKLLNLQEIVSYYVNYQREVVFKRTKFDLEVSEKREHVLEGILIAINNIDDVIKIIKASKSSTEAKTSLKETFYLSDIQAQAILDMRLARLTNLEVNKIETELKQLKTLIAKLKRILKSEKMQFEIVKKELLEIKENYATPRKSELVDDSIEPDNEIKSKLLHEVDVNIANIEYVNVIYSPGKTIKAVQQKSYNLSTKELSATPTEFEIPHLNITMLNNKLLYLITNEGNCYTVKITDLPQVKFKDKGEFVFNIIKNFERNEEVVAMFDIDQNNINDEFVFVTKQGNVKITKISEFFTIKQKIQAIKLRENDEVVNAFINNKDQTVSMFTKQGFALNFDKTDIAVTARVGFGVKGISLSENDEVVAGYQIMNNYAFSIFANNGFAKVIKSSEVTTLPRARKGTKVIAGKEKDISLVNVFLLDKNVSYVIKQKSGDLTFVLNKKMTLDKRTGFGKSVVKSKSKSNTVEKIYAYVTI